MEIKQLTGFRIVILVVITEAEYRTEKPETENN